MAFVWIWVFGLQGVGGEGKGRQQSNIQTFGARCSFCFLLRLLLFFSFFFLFFHAIKYVTPGRLLV